MSAYLFEAGRLLDDLSAHVLAHGIGGRSDLPLPTWLFANSAVAALLVSFLLLGFLWKRPRLAQAGGGRTFVAGWVGFGTRFGYALLQAVGLVMFFVVLWAALFAPLGEGASIAPVAIFVVFWVGFQVVSGVLGNVWRPLSPWETLADLGSGVRGARAAHQVSAASHERPAPHPIIAGGWLGVLAVAAFMWLELVHPEPAGTRWLGWGIVAYTIVMLAGAALYGRQWLRRNEGFGVLLGQIAAMGPLTRGGESGGETGSDRDLNLKARPWLAGLSKLNMSYASTALVLLVLGSTTYDGMSGTRWWGDLTQRWTGWDLVPYSTLGWLGCVLAVALGYLLAVAAAVWLTGSHIGSQTQGRAPDRSFVAHTLQLSVRFSHSLVPLLLAYSIAHYFSLLVFEGQDFLALLSDPFGRGWDLFGTAHFTINYRLVSTETIAWVQAMSIVVGHIGGVVVAHDRALELFEPKAALRSQLPLLMVMVGYTLVGLLILLNA